METSYVMAHKTSQHIILRMCLVSSTNHEPCISYLIVFRGRHLLFLWPLRYILSFECVLYVARSTDLASRTLSHFVADSGSRALDTRRKCISHRILSCGRWHDYMGKNKFGSPLRGPMSHVYIKRTARSHRLEPWHSLVVTNRERERVCLSRCVADVYVLNSLFKNSKRSLRFALLAQ
jgi:hypothetical protein